MRNYCNSESVEHLINEVYRINEKEYNRLRNGFKGRKEFLPSLKQCEYLNDIGYECITRVENRIIGSDIPKKRATYHFFKKVFLQAYFNLIGIPTLQKNNSNKDLEKIYVLNRCNKINLGSHEKDIAIRIVEDFVHQFIQVVWIDISMVQSNHQFIKRINETTSFIFCTNLKNEFQIFEIIKNKMVLFVFDGMTNEIKEYPYYKNFIRVFEENKHKQKSIWIIEINNKNSEDFL